MTIRTLKALAATLWWTIVMTGPAAATDVGVSIAIGDPNFYGRIEIGSFPRPVLIYPEPIVIQPVPVGVVRAPVYMHVPPGHARNWGKHCRKYGACGYPVFFVQDAWYQDVYVPAYRETKQKGRKGRGHGRGDHDD